MKSVLALFVVTSVVASIASAPHAAEALTGDALFDAIAAQDAAAFDAFNHCADPDQLRKHESYFAPDVEFYHDTGGVTWTRDAMLANTKKYACGNYRRELIAGSMKVYPVKDFGAISQGSHRFCNIADGKCAGLADFTIIWRQTDGAWQMTRVLSYGHRAVSESVASPKP